MAAISYDVQWVDIVNRALTRVGLTQISNLDEGSSGANYGSQLLPQAIETVYPLLTTGETQPNTYSLYRLLSLLPMDMRTSTHFLRTLR